MKPWAEIFFIVFALIFGCISGFIIGQQRGVIACLDTEVDLILEKIETTSKNYNKLRKYLGIGGQNDYIKRNN